jgi:hypothetical protein
MPKRVWISMGLAAAALTVLLLAGCATLDVTAPPGMFVSTGDFVPGVKTLGIIQEQTTVFAPLFLMDINRVNQGLYDALIKKAQAVGANGLTNIRFSWKPSPLTWLTFYIVSGVFDFYIEGVAIRTP